MSSSFVALSWPRATRQSPHAPAPDPASARTSSGCYARSKLIEVATWSRLLVNFAGLKYFLCRLDRTAMTFFGLC